MEKERFSGMFMDWVMTFLVVAILATVCNIVGYDGGFIESLPGMLIFGLISLAGRLFLRREFHNMVHRHVALWRA